MRSSHPSLSVPTLSAPASSATASSLLLCSPHPSILSSSFSFVTSPSSHYTPTTARLAPPPVGEELLRVAPYAPAYVTRVHGDKQGRTVWEFAWKKESGQVCALRCIATWVEEPVRSVKFRTTPYVQMGEAWIKGVSELVQWQRWSGWPVMKKPVPSVEFSQRSML
jgi:hypothetical protein